MEKLTNKSYNGEIASVAEAIIKASEKGNFESDVYLTGLLSTLKEEFAKISEAIKQTSVASVLEEKDTQRNDKLRAVFYLTRGYVYHPDTTINEAAKQLIIILDKYGLTTIIRNNYAQTSGYITALLKDLSSNTNKALINQLSGLIENIKALDTAQADFATTFVQYESEKAQFGQLESATTIKKRILKHVNNDISTYLSVMLKANAELYETFAQSVKQIITDHNEKVKNRKVKAKQA